MNAALPGQQCGKDGRVIAAAQRFSQVFAADGNDDVRLAGQWRDGIGLVSGRNAPSCAGQCLFQCGGEVRVGAAAITQTDCDAASPSRQG